MATLAGAIGAAAQPTHNRDLWMVTLPEGASQTFKAWEIVDLNAGYLRRAGGVSAGDSLDGNALILGRCTRDGQNGSAGAKENTVIVADDGTLFRFPVWNTGLTAKLTQADLGVKYEIKYATGPAWVIDVGATTNTKAIVVAFAGDPEQDTPGERNIAWSTSAGEVHGHVMAKIIAAQRQFG